MVAEPDTGPTDPDYTHIFNTLSEGDRLNINNRQTPLLVKRIKDHTDTRRIILQGPQGGEYCLERTGEHEPRFGRITDRRRGIPQLDTTPITTINIEFTFDFEPGQLFHVADGKEEIEHYHFITGTGNPTEDNEVIHITLDPRDEDPEANTHYFPYIPYHMRRRLYEGNLEHIDTIHLGYGTGRTHYYDTVTDAEVYLSGPHGNGIDMRPIDGTGITVLWWGEFLTTYQDRFTEVPPDT